MNNLNFKNLLATKKKYFLIGGLVAVVAAIVAVGYLVWLPSSAAKQFTTEAESAHNQVVPAMDKVYDSFSGDLFTDTEQGAVDAKAETKDALSAITEAESVLSQSRSKAKLKSLPGASINGSYKKAQKLSQDQARYFNDAEAFLATYKEVITYIDKAVDAGVEAEAGSAELASALYDEDLDASISKLESAINKIDGAVSTIKKLTPPKVMTEYHEQSIKEIERMVASLRKLVDAWKAGDDKNALEAGNELEALLNGTSDSDKALITLQRDSELSKAIENLKNLQRDLRGRF